MNFAELTQRVQDRISDSTSSTEDVIEDKINETLEEIFGEVDIARWYYREAGFDTTARLTGTTAGSTTVRTATSPYARGGGS